MILQTANWEIEIGLKLNSKHQLLVYVGDANILGGSVRTTEKNIKS